MLTELRIANFAVIEEVTVRFGPGLNALTGETGAGKSLLVEAIDLVLGARGSADRVRQGAREAEITARFELEAGDVSLPLEAADLEEGSLVLRRVLGADGRSRAYVNERPSTLGRLRELGRALADLHGQHEQQNLLSEETHLDYLDAVGEAKTKAAHVSQAHARAVTARAQRDTLLASSRESAQAREFHRFQLEELNAADLRVGEEESLQSERHLAAHAGRLAAAAEEAVQALSGDPGAAELLGRASKLLAQASVLDASLEPLRNQVDEALVIADDVLRELNAYRERLGADPDRLDAIEHRLDLLARLRRKYHAGIGDLIAKRDELAGLLTDLDDAPHRLAELEREVETADRELSEAASELSALRSRAAADFARRVSRELQGLGMSGARFRVELRPLRSGLEIPGRVHPVNARGAEEAVFVLAANPGEKEGPLARIASGGEISRVMLALKNVMRRVDPVPVAIFDEVDAGVGGLVAEAVAGRLSAVAGERQVIVVTHLAVVASRAAHHLHLVKSTRNRRTVIAVESLEGASREEELARMLAGTAGGDAARRTARTLLSGDSR